MEESTTRCMHCIALHEVNPDSSPCTSGVLGRSKPNHPHTRQKTYQHSNPLDPLLIFFFFIILATALAPPSNYKCFCWFFLGGHTWWHSKVILATRSEITHDLEDYMEHRAWNWGLSWVSHGRPTAALLLRSINHKYFNIKNKHYIKVEVEKYSH